MRVTHRCSPSVEDGARSGRGGTRDLLPLLSGTMRGFTHQRAAAQDGLREKLGAGPVATEVRDAPFVQIPLGVTEDRLVGTVDIEASMKARPGPAPGAS